MGSIPGDEGGSDRDFPTLAGGMCFCVSDGYVICVTPDKSVVPFLSKMFVLAILWHFHAGVCLGKLYDTTVAD